MKQSSILAALEASSEPQTIHELLARLSLSKERSIYTRVAVILWYLERAGRVISTRSDKESPNHGLKEFTLNESWHPKQRQRPKPSREKLENRFWSCVAKGQDAECWPWKKAKDRDGYGAARWGGRHWKAHRVAFLLTHGTFSPALLVCHSCDNPPCCNPAHLWLGTNKDNLQDMFRKGRAVNWMTLFPERRPRGEAVAVSKLTCKQVLEARHLRLSHQWGLDRLAANYGISRSGIRFAVIGKTWSHVNQDQPLKCQHCKESR